MVKLYHYTSLENYESIKKDGFLFPSTPIVHPFLNNIFLLRQDVKKEYIFCLNDPKPKDWLESGWLDALKDKKIGEEYALFSFSVDNPIILNGSFSHEVLDDIGVSLRFDIGPWEAIAKTLINAPRVRRAFKNYVNSKIPLSEYDGSYRLVEYLVSDNIPFSNLNLEELVKEK